MTVSSLVLLRLAKITATLVALLLALPIFVLFARVAVTGVFVVGGIDSLLARLVAFSFIATILFVVGVLAALRWEFNYSIVGICYLLVVTLLFCCLWHMQIVVL